MKLTEEKKQQILNSLKEDYVPFSDVFHEICADTVADMLFVGATKTELGKQDRLALHQLENDYFRLIPDNYADVIPIVEQVLALQSKYHYLRREH